MSRKINNYEVSHHNSVVADTLKEAFEAEKNRCSDLKVLAQWEQQGKIEAECGSDSPSFQIITVLDKSIEPELQKIGIVSWYETEVDEDEEPDDNTEEA